MPYIDLPFEDGDDDPDLMVTAALQRLQETVDGFIADDNAVETAMLHVVMERLAESRALTRDYGAGGFRAFGERIVRLPRRQGTAAVGTVVFAMRAGGGTVPAGTLVAWPAPGGPVGFTTVADVTAAAGAAESPPVQVVAEFPGTYANGLPAGQVDVVEALASVTGARATDTSGGGTDAEDDLDYTDRLADALTLWSTTPVQAAQFAVLAQQTPGVARALAVDNYDPATDTGAQERMVAVFPLDPAGADPAAPVRDALRTSLEETREVNFLVPLGTAAFTAVTVDFTAVAEPSVDPAAVRAAAVDAVATFLSPATWGGGDERPPVWRDVRTVRYLDIVAVVARVEGIQSVTDVTLNAGRVDVVLGTRPGVLPQATVTGAVAAP
jgi:hypothetical protein